MPLLKIFTFHKFGEYFPGTGDVHDVGHADGKNYSINFPLNDGMDDKAYRSVFRPVIGKIMEMFAPGAVVLQCGADSLSGDRLGCFNLSVKGHADCVEYVRSFNVCFRSCGVAHDQRIKPCLSFLRTSSYETGTMFLSTCIERLK